MPARTVSVLLVGPAAADWATVIDPDGADVTAAESQTAARAYLAGTTFDAVFIQDGAPGADAIRALRDVLGLAAPVETVGSAHEVLAWIGRQRDGAAPRSDRASTGVAYDELVALRAELGRVAHALNNPLAVIAGNAQLGLELAAALGTDEGVVETLEGIREAAAELAELFSEVSALRARVDRIVGS